MKKTAMLLLAAVSLPMFAADEPNLALNKSATATSLQGNNFSADKAVDGKKNTRWSSQFKDGQMLTVDLGAAQTVGRVKIAWEGAAAKEYTVQTSMDGKEWKDVAAKKDGKSWAKAEFSFAPEQARYVRINGKTRTTKFGFSIFELEVFAK